MTRLPDIINNRSIFYLEIGNSLQELADLELKNWVLFVIEDYSSNAILWPFAELCIGKELLYMIAVGRACSEVDDLFDEVMVIKTIEHQKLPSWMISEDDVLMTSWDHDFNEAFWFVTSVANYSDLPIHTVVVANFTSTNYLPLIENLTAKISEGWLPPD